MEMCYKKFKNFILLFVSNKVLAGISFHEIEIGNIDDYAYLPHIIVSVAFLLAIRTHIYNLIEFKSSCKCSLPQTFL